MKSLKTLPRRQFALISVFAALLVGSVAAEIRAPRGLASAPALTSAPQPLANTLGEQKVLVMLVNFQNNPTSQPFTVDQVRNTVFGSVSNFYFENSYHQTWLTGDVYGWLTIPLNSTVCDTQAMAQYANAAAVAAGANLWAYGRYVYVFPHNSCSFAGYTATSSNSVPRVYMNGDLSVKAVAHELGHSFGLHHSEALECGAVSIGSNCTVVDYGDKFDDMGGGSANFNAYHKERLGWLNYGSSTPSITTVETSGTYFIEPMASPSAGGPKALKILKSVNPVNGDKTWYYVEFRQAVGFDSPLSSNSNVMNGVLIHEATQFTNSFNLFHSYLLDMTPETSSWLDPALAMGRTFQEPTAGFSVTPVTCTSAGCSVLVNFSSQSEPCVNSAPTVTMTPSQPAGVLPGTPVTFTVTVRNNDTASCSNSTFNLQAGVPAGWLGILGSTTVSPGPGQTATTSLSVTAPASAVVGSYNVGVSATSSASSAYSGSASAVFSVASQPPPPPSLTVTVSTDKSIYNVNQTVTIVGEVRAGSAPVSGASVTFTITKANNVQVKLTGTTATNGKVVAKYRVNKKDPKGTYQDDALVSTSGSTGSATTTFVVQ